jgi:hypothetical protein
VLRTGPREGKAWVNFAILDNEEVVVEIERPGFPRTFARAITKSLEEL